MTSSRNWKQTHNHTRTQIDKTMNDENERKKNDIQLNCTFKVFLIRLFFRCR